MPGVPFLHGRRDGADVDHGVIQQLSAGVLMERAHEFTLEAKRWFDLVRTRQALPVIQALNEPITEKNLLWPIPLEELANNKALSLADQNPGW